MPSARRRLGLEPIGLTDLDLERIDELVGAEDRVAQLVGHEHRGAHR